EHDDDSFRKADRAQRIRNRKLFKLLDNACLAAHAGRVEHLDGAAAPIPLDRNTVTGDARFRSCQKTVFTEITVDESGFASIGTTDDRHAKRLGLVINGLFFLVV